MTYPKNEKEWWASLEEHWENLMDIMAKFLPIDLIMANFLPIDLNTTNPEINHHMHLEFILTAKKNKHGHTLAKMLNKTWAAAPDEPWIHELPSWGVLCDLCSESYVLGDDDGPPEKN
ncbi:MAG TPA: hypothetical protein VMX17_15775 [Candidatus Glassbacteria bacterium]|nr:hypothetical protein [Candidatus Glassbacteria bacterium]